MLSSLLLNTTQPIQRFSQYISISETEYLLPFNTTTLLYMYITHISCVHGILLVVSVVCICRSEDLLAICVPSLQHSQVSVKFTYLSIV